MFVSLALFACSGTPQPPPATAPAKSEHEGHEMGHEGHEMGHEGHEGHEGHDGHAAGGGHMAEMAKTRDALRQQLGEAYDAPVAGLDQADVAAGKTTYDANCATCHGAGGKGDGPAAAGLNPPPADFTDAFHARYYSDAGRVHVIKKGSPGTAMAGFEAALTEPQVLEVYAYVRSLRPAPGTGG